MFNVTAVVMLNVDNDNCNVGLVDVVVLHGRSRSPAYAPLASSRLEYWLLACWLMISILHGLHIILVMCLKE